KDEAALRLGDCYFNRTPERLRVVRRDETHDRIGPLQFVVERPLPIGTGLNPVTWIVIEKGVMVIAGQRRVDVVGQRRVFRGMTEENLGHPDARFYTAASSQSVGEPAPARATRR